MCGTKSRERWGCLMSVLSIVSLRLSNKRATQSQERPAQAPALPPVFSGGIALKDWTVTLEMSRSTLFHIQAEQTKLKPDQTFQFPTQLLSHDQVEPQKLTRRNLFKSWRSMFQVFVKCQSSETTQCSLAKVTLIFKRKSKKILALLQKSSLVYW